MCRPGYKRTFFSARLQWCTRSLKAVSTERHCRSIILCFFSWTLWSSWLGQCLCCGAGGTAQDLCNGRSNTVPDPRNVQSTVHAPENSQLYSIREEESEDRLQLKKCNVEEDTFSLALQEVPSILTDGVEVGKIHASTIQVALADESGTSMTIRIETSPKVPAIWGILLLKSAPFSQGTSSSSRVL